MHCRKADGCKSKEEPRKRQLQARRRLQADFVFINPSDIHVSTHLRSSPEDGLSIEEGTLSRLAEIRGYSAIPQICSGVPAAHDVKWHSSTNLQGVSG